MSLITVDYGELGGVQLNPTLLDHDTKTRTTTPMKTFTIDVSKHYILVLTYRYNDTTYRTNSYYVADGTVTLLGGDQSATGLTVTLDGTSLSVKGDSAGSTYSDMTLFQLD